MKPGVQIFLILIPLLFASGDAFAGSSALKEEMRVHEKELMLLSDSLINAEAEENRIAASMGIIKVFAKALRKENSFQFPFDSLNSIAIQAPADSIFRIITWQLRFDNGTHRYFGVIQMNQPKPSIFPLVDYGGFYEKPANIIVNHDRWIGALYYNIIPQKKEGKKYYTLLGWDANHALSNKKYIDVLWFDSTGVPKFGYPLFELLDEDERQTRVVFEYRKDAVMSITYHETERTIYYDHLVNIGGSDVSFGYDNVPDGTLEGFEWKNGRWLQIEMIEHDIREDGDVPNVIEEEQKPSLYRPLQPR